MIIDWLDRLYERLIHRYGGLEFIQLFLLFFTLECAALGLAAVVTRLSSGFMLFSRSTCSPSGGRVSS